MYNNNDDVSLHSSTKLCKQFTSYNFPPIPLCVKRQQWNGIMWIITFSNKQYSFLCRSVYCWCSGASVLAAGKMFLSHTNSQSPAFVCYYSILILFFSRLLNIVSHHFSASCRPHFAFGSFFFIAFFPLLLLLTLLPWHGVEKIILLPIFHSFPHSFVVRIEDWSERQNVGRLEVNCQSSTKRVSENKKRCEVKDEKHIFASSL